MTDAVRRVSHAKNPPPHYDPASRFVRQKSRRTGPKRRPTDARLLDPVPFSCERSEGCGGRSDPQDARTTNHSKDAQNTRAIHSVAPATPVHNPEFSNDVPILS